MHSDVVVVGSGIVGMACAWAAWKRGREVLVLDKDDFCVGASLRNFGFVTVTGQGRGQTWSRAMASRDIWQEVVGLAGIQVVQQGLLVLIQRDEAYEVAQQLMTQPEGAALKWLDKASLEKLYPQRFSSRILGALYSPHELRIESRHAIGQLKTWMASLGIKFENGAAASLDKDSNLVVNGKVLPYRDLVLAPGPDIRAFAPDLYSQLGVNLCRLSMLRVRPPEGYVLPAPVMSDLSMIRYKGYAELSASSALLRRLSAEQPEHLKHGVHLIAVQSADGTLVVGDSHHYGTSIGPFVDTKTEALILEEMQAVLALEHFEVTERWVGYYPSGSVDAIIHPLGERSSLVSVTSGTGMSTAFALGLEWAKERL